MYQKSVREWLGRLPTCHWAREAEQSSDPASAGDWLYSLGQSPDASKASISPFVKERR